MDNGPLFKIPNSIMIQAGIIKHDLKERWVRVKFEVPTSIEPTRLLPILEETIKKNEWVAKQESVRVMVNTANLASYVVTIDAVCKGDFEEPPRSSILIDTVHAVNNLKEQVRQSEPAHSQ